MKLLEGGPIGIERDDRFLGLHKAGPPALDLRDREVLVTFVFGGLDDPQHSPQVVVKTLLGGRFAHG